jgi:molybdate transport system regulatory protein
MHTAATLVAEGPAPRELAELTVHLFVCSLMVQPSRSHPESIYRRQAGARRPPAEAENVAISHPRAWQSANMARLRVSIVFESGARIGPGKAKLLESIRETGSISAAARDMGMSYKRAWLLLDSMNQAFTELVATASPGGAGGGGATLTPFGAELLERYHRILDQSATMAADDLTALGRRARPEAGPKV